MDVNGFLAGLPALLGIVGFIVYQILQHFGRPNAVVSAIVEKLRLAAPERVPDQRLTAISVDRLLRRDDGLRRIISEQDFALLKKVLNQQFVTALVVYVLCGGLCIFGVLQYVKQQNATKVTGIGVLGPGGEHTLVDLDPLTVNWKSEGDRQRLRVYLENVLFTGAAKPTPWNPRVGLLHFVLMIIRAFVQFERKVGAMGFTRSSKHLIMSSHQKNLT